MPGDDKVSLGMLYARAYRLNGYFHLLYDIMRNIKSLLKDTSSEDKDKKALKAFIEAFNSGIATFGNALWQDMQLLYETGEMGKTIPSLKVGPFDEKADPTVGPCQKILSVRQTKM
jgi:hypothetical protein